MFVVFAARREADSNGVLFALGIPTTRSLAVVLTGGNVLRESVLQGAVLVRVAESHIRVGTFNFAAAFGTKNDVRKLADYCIWRHFPHIEGDENKYLSLLRETARRQALLIAEWQLAGFVHGVMNTDMGITSKSPQDAAIIAEHLNYMKEHKLDYTNTFRALNAANPAVIPRNHRVEEALAAAEQGDFT